MKSVTNIDKSMQHICSEMHLYINLFRYEKTYASLDPTVSSVKNMMLLDGMFTVPYFAKMHPQDGRTSFRGAED